MALGFPEHWEASWRQGAVMEKAPGAQRSSACPPPSALPQRLCGASLGQAGGPLGLHSFDV